MRGGPMPLSDGPASGWAAWARNGSAGAGTGAGASAGAGAEGGGRNGSAPFGRNEELAKLEVAVLAVTFAAALLGNCSVLLALHRTPRKTSRMHLFIRHLSLADLAVAFFQVLPQLCWDVTHRFRGPDGLCRVVKHLQVFSMFASAYVLLAMTADRYIAVCHPLKTLQRPARRSRAMIAAAWTLSLLLSVPQYFVFSFGEVQPGSGVFDCWADFVQPWGQKAYVTWMTASIFLAPVLVLATCYGFICYHIWRNIRGKTGLGPRPGLGLGPGAGAGPPGRLLLTPCVSSIKSISRAKIRTVKMTLVIVTVYVVCSAPFFVVQMWSTWDVRFVWLASEDAVVTITALLASLNSCCNPWIYMFFSGHLLQDCIQSFPCCRKSRQKLTKEDSDSLSRRQTSLTNNRSPTNSSGAWRDSPRSSKSTKFIPVST